MNLNEQLFNFLFSITHKSPFLDGIFVFFAKYLTYLLVAALLIWIFNKIGRRRIFIFGELVIAIIVSRGLITEWIRFLYYNPRPFEALGFTSLIGESGASFPSGHMTFLFALGVCAFLYDKKFGGWFLGLSFVVGLARIFAGVHWPLDILGGILIGVASGFFIHKLLSKYWKELELPKEDVVVIEEVKISEEIK